MLILGSLIFYAWSGFRFLPLVLLSVLLNYGIGAAMHRHRGQARTLVYAGVLFDLGLLGWFKYAGFVGGNIAAVFGHNPFTQAIVLPLAISFFTFQQIAYLVETDRGAPPAGSLLDYTLFILFFPHLIAGPITHHTEMLPQFARSGRGSLDRRLLMTGAAILVLGLAKKTLLADTLATVADPVFAAATVEPLTPAEAWQGALAYTLQLYFDFSGYSDMAIALGLLFGIRFPVNFASPYQADSIIEFWRRWHITLSRFLRLYLYIPLGGNRRGAWRRHGNLMATMVLGGLWHGAGWGFVAWGALHGAYLVANHLWRGAFGQARAPAARLAGWAVTFTSVVAAWVCFRAASLPAALRVWTAMAGASDGLATPGLPIQGLPGPAATIPLLAVAAGIAWLLPNTLVLTGYVAAPAPRRTTGWTFRPGLTAAALGVVAALCFARLPNPGVFLYFNF